MKYKKINNIYSIALLLFSIILCLNVTTAITDCQNLNISGVYSLDNDLIVNSTECLVINADDIIINGNNYKIYINESSSSAIRNIYGNINLTIENITFESNENILSVYSILSDSGDINLFLNNVIFDNVTSGVGLSNGIMQIQANNINNINTLPSGDVLFNLDVVQNSLLNNVTITMRPYLAYGLISSLGSLSNTTFTNLTLLDYTSIGKVFYPSLYLNPGLQTYTDGSSVYFSSNSLDIPDYLGYDNAVFNNTSGTVYFFNLPNATYQIFRNNITCLSCSNINYLNGNLIFDISEGGFYNYSYTIMSNNTVSNNPLFDYDFSTLNNTFFYVIMLIFSVLVIIFISNPLGCMFMLLLGFIALINLDTLTFGMIIIITSISIVFINRE